MAQNRHNSYLDTRRRLAEFEVGDHVVLKVSPLNRSMRFRKKYKLIPRFINALEILQRVGLVAY